MSKKEKNTSVEDVKVEEVKTPEPFKFGISPCLTIAMVREEKRVYRFEMPIGAHLDECKEACNECLVIIQKMRDEAEAKISKEKEKVEKEEKEKEDSDKEESFSDIE